MQHDQTAAAQVTPSLSSSTSSTSSKDAAVPGNKEDHQKEEQAKSSTVVAAASTSDVQKELQKDTVKIFIPIVNQIECSYRRY